MKRALAPLLILNLAALIAMVHLADALPQGQPRPQIVRLDPRFDALVPRDAKLERVAEGIAWAEGPVWNRKGGFLLFSDVPSNVILKWQRGNSTSVFLKPSGYTGTAPFAGPEPGSNGLAFDAQGRVVYAAHGDRGIFRLEADSKRTPLAVRYQGKRLNSPNDVVIKSNGDYYFTDPPFGLPGTYQDPGKELPFQGVYRLTRDGQVTLLTKEIQAPNGIAFSPDEKKLVVSDSATTKWWIFDVQPDGTIANGRVLFDGSALREGRPGVADGLKIDRNGNVFAAAPGGLFVIASDGTLLGRFDLGTATGNCAWGEDGSTLFITSNHVVYRIRLATKGAGF